MARSIMSRALAAGALIVTAFNLQSVQAMPYDNVFVFGDSLVDSGNRAILDGTQGALAPLGYFQDRISDGPSLGDWLTFHASGQPLGVPSLDGGNNYSYAGARIRDNSNDLGPGSDTTPDLAAQVAEYQGNNPGPAGANDLFIINAGGNDIRDFGFGIPGILGLSDFDFITEVVTAFVTEVVNLELAGAQNILVMGIPDASRAPEAIAFAQTLPDPDAFLAGSRGGSELLRDLILANLALRPTAGLSDLRFFDYLPFTDALVAAPEDFGFAPDLNVTTPCIGFMGENGAPDVDCSSFGFFDSIHPTSPLHRQIAQQALRQTFGIRVSEPATLVLLGMGVVGLMGLRRRA